MAFLPPPHLRPGPAKPSAAALAADRRDVAEAAAKLEAWADWARAEPCLPGYVRGLGSWAAYDAATVAFFREICGQARAKRSLLA